MICTDLGFSALKCAVPENVHTSHGGHYLVLDPPPPPPGISGGCLSYPPPSRISMNSSLCWILPEKDISVKNDAVALYFYAKAISSLYLVVYACYGFKKSLYIFRGLSFITVNH